jgi:hypothetical protein
LQGYYKHGVNACVVKRVDFAEFMKAVRLPSAFWAAVKEPPPQRGTAETAIQGRESISPRKERG